MNEKDGAIRDASVLGVPKMLILGLQHMFAMFGATILVPILVNSYFGEDVLHVQVTLICAGNRSDHHLHRTEPCRFCHQQRFHQLASRPHRSGYDHRFQYLGQGNV